MPHKSYTLSLVSILLISFLLFGNNVLLGDNNLRNTDTNVSEIYRKTQQADSLLRARKLDIASALIDTALMEARKVLPAGDTGLAYVLNVAGKAAFYESDYEWCHNAWQEAFDIRRKALGLDHELTAASLNNLGALANAVGEFEKAESLYTEVLHIRQRIQPENHPDFAGLYTNLGSLKRITGQYAEAESLYNLAYDINLAGVGLNHPVSAGCLNNIAVLYEEQGRYELAREYYLKGLNILKETLGEKHPRTASSLNNLGNLYFNMKDYVRAESLYTQALEIRREVFGENHLALASSYNNLASVYLETGDNLKAETYYKKALDIKAGKLPANHPLLASSYDNLGIVYYNKGEYDKSEEYYNKSQAIYSQTYGDIHPYTTASKANIAGLHAAMGRYSRALEEYNQVFETRRRFIRDVFTYAGETNKLKYLRKYPLIDNKLLSLTAKLKSPEAIRLAFKMVLESKAMVVDAICAEKEMIFTGHDPLFKEQFDTWREVSGKLSNLALSGVDHLKTEIYKQKIDSLFAIKDSVELQLSKNYAGFSDEYYKQDVNIDRLAACLAPDEVLWEFVKYDYYNFDIIGSDNIKTGAAKYLVFILDHEGRLSIVEPGEALAIDRMIDDIRQGIYSADRMIYSFGEQAAEISFNDQTVEFYNSIIRPLVAESRDAMSIYVAADGEFNLIPFEIIPCGDGEYMIEKYNLHYLSSGRDLLSFESPAVSIDNVLIMADPDYSCHQTSSITDRDDTSDNIRGNNLRAGNDCLLGEFTRLPFTHLEADQIKTLFEKSNETTVNSYYDSLANEETLKEYDLSPQILHLATHGFFCDISTSNEGGLLQNPLLRSGIALANANCLGQLAVTDIQGLDEDGILTAFEASGLNLYNTELVVLSACETGVGEVENGEGVFGLRRAFQYAGAEAILMSLWKVGESETTSLMISFYDNCIQGKSKSQALREASIGIMNERRNLYDCAHPYYWGGFILLGNPH